MTSRGSQTKRNELSARSQVPFLATPSATLTVVGNTDTSISDAYAIEISQQIAKNMAAELVRQGVPEDQIEVRWRGAANLCVLTGPAVREPQNRRVEIIFSE
jgi:OOP family OmpA-OmpF porin